MREEDGGRNHVHNIIIHRHRERNINKFHIGRTHGIPFPLPVVQSIEMVSEATRISLRTSGIQKCPHTFYYVSLKPCYCPNHSIRNNKIVSL